MDSSYEDSDVELEGSFAQTGSVATISNPPSDPATIPLSRPFDGTKPDAKPQKAAAPSVAPAVGTFHEPLMSLSFDGDEEEEEDESEEDVQLDNTPADAAQPRGHRAPPVPVVRPSPPVRAASKAWTCKECTYAENAFDADQCEMCDCSRHAQPQKKETKGTDRAPNKPERNMQKELVKETYKKPEPRPPKTETTNKATVDQNSTDNEDGRDKEKAGLDDEEDEDELSLDSDREFDMPAFDAVILPDSQSIMMTASTLPASSATQRIQSIKVPSQPAQGKPKHNSDEAIKSSDEVSDEELDLAPKKRTPPKEKTAGKVTNETKEETKLAKGKEKASYDEQEEESDGIAEKKGTQKLSKSSAAKGETKPAVQVVASSCEFDDLPWDNPNERQSSNKADTPKKNAAVSTAKASRAEVDFMKYARNRKKHGDGNEYTTESTPPREAKPKPTWIATSSKDSRKPTPARRTAQRKNRVIQSSSDEEESEDQCSRSTTKRTQGEKKAKRSQARKEKKAKKRSPRPDKDKWREDSDEDENIDHDHGNGTEEEEEESDSEERVVKSSATKKGKAESSSSSSSSSKGKERTSDLKGERRKAKRKSREVPEEDTESDAFIWKKIEKKMIACKSEAMQPRSEEQLFRGLQFLITGLGSEDDDNEERSAERIIKLVTDEGGQVLNNFTNASLASQCKKRSGYTGLPATMLLSATPRTTLKYLLAVAAGLPTIHYNWLIHCCQQRCLLPHTLYLLPAGYSVEKNCEVFIKKPRSDIFESMRVEVVGPPEFKNMWRLVLKEGGAKVVERLFTPQEDRVECVVSPPDPEDYLRVKLKRLARAGVPVVGKQWVVQSLLNQRMADTEDELYHFENY